MRLFLLLPFLLLFGCNHQRSSEKEVAANIRLLDDLERELVLKQRPQRVLALAPSMTEMLAAVAGKDQIIARTEHCNYPAWVQQLPVLNTYPLDVERVLQLRPDLVLTVEGMTSLENAQKLQELGIPVYYQQYRTVEDICKGLEKLGKVLGREKRAQHVADSLRQELRKLVEQPGEQQSARPRVVALAWQDPIMLYGHNTLFTDKIALAGGVNAADSTMVQAYPTVTREYLLRLNPDVIISRSFADMDTSFFRRYPELRVLKAYKTRRIFDTDADLMERPSPRVVESVKELLQLLNN